MLERLTECTALHTQPNMNRIAFTKNGLPLLICTQLTILIIICVPLCSTGIVKREIETINTTESNWEPVRIANNTSVNVTTTTTARTTTTTAATTTTPKFEKSSSTTPSTTKFTPRISRRRTTTTTEKHSTTQATTEKYAELISKDNVTTVVATVTESQPVQPTGDKDNLDDDAEIIPNFDGGVTTEEQRFDLSRYTSDYNGFDKDPTDRNETHQQLTNDDDNDSDTESDTVTYNTNYEHNLHDMVLTTPETAYFDEKHKEYNVHSDNNDKSYERYQDQNNVAANDRTKAADRHYNPDALLNDIHGNSTEERKQSTYVNQAELESTKYDVSTNEIKNSTRANGAAPSEKRGKFMQEGSHVNLTIPSASEVWALASMKNVEHTKNQQGKFYNLSSHEKEPDESHNGTLVTKQLADWMSITKNNDFASNSYTASIADTANSKDTSNRVDTAASSSDTVNSRDTSNTVDAVASGTDAVASGTDPVNSRDPVKIERIREHLAETVRNLNGTNFQQNDTTTNVNSTFRGRLKYQPKPIITIDQDTASQENHIIAVRVTTLPPPIAVTENHSAFPPPYPKISDSQNSINFPDVDDESTASVTTDMATEMVTQKNDVDMEMTTTVAQSVDDSHNELKTKFQIENVTTTKPAAESEFETPTDRTFTNTTTDRTLQLTTEIAPKTSSDNVVEVMNSTEAYETITLLTTAEPSQSHTTTEKEFPTTNSVNLETESITEIDEDDRTTPEQTTLTTENLPVSTDNEILESQSSTLHPQYVEIEKTTEMKNPTTENAHTTQSSTPQPQYVGIDETTEKKPTTESTHTSPESIEPITSEAVDRTMNKEVTSTPDAETDSTQELTTTIINLNRDEYKYSTIKSRLEDATQSPHSLDAIPEVIDNNSQPSTTDKQNPDGHSLDEPDTNAVIAISISCVGVVVVGAVLAVLFVLRKRKKQLTYGQRCRPVGLDAYSLDNVSVYNSVRRKGMLRMSKRSYGNAAFDDPGLKNNLLTGAALTAFAQKKSEIYEEFKELPAVTARVEEVPIGCEDKNRYANIVPLPETRVFLKRIDDDEKTEYINANFVKGPKDSTQYYIACQAPLESTIVDFWRMIWEQNSRVIIMATDLIENGIEQCSEYLPPSFVIDNHVTFGDFHITLKHREVKEKYAMSMVHVKNMNTNTWREVTHFWYQWPDTGVPTEQSSIIELLLEARGFLKVTTAEQIDDNENSQSKNGNLAVGNGNNVDKSKSLLRTQGPLTVHCSPGTGRTGTIIACDIALRALEQPTRSVDIPQIVYFVRRGRASAVRTREQYEFIYKVANVYAAKLTGPATEN